MDKFNEFIHCRKIAKGSDFTHTSIENPPFAFYVQAEDNDEFIKLYSQVKFGQKCIVEFKGFNTMFRMDIDLKFDIKTIRYNDEFITNLIDLIRKELTTFSPTLENLEIEILRRPKITPQKNYNKDGLHLLIPELVEKNDHLVKYIVNKLVNNLEIKKLLNDIMLVDNSFNDVFDTSIYHKNGFMMVGSDKVYDSGNCYTPYCKSSTLGEITKYEKIPAKDMKDLVKNFSIRCKDNTIDKILDEEGKSNYNELVKINNEKEIKEIEKIKEKKQNTKIYNKIVDKDEIIELVDCLNFDRANHYDTWSVIGWILFNIDENLFYIFDLFSQAGDYEYVEDEVAKFWLNCKKGDYTIGSLYHYAKIDNPDEYTKIRSKYSKFNQNQFPNWNDEELGKDFANRFADIFIYQDTIVYAFNKVIWQVDKEDIIILKFIANDYYKTLSKLSLQLKKEEEDKINNKNIEDDEKDEELEKLDELFTNRKKNLQNLKTNKFIKNLLDVIKRQIYDDLVEFDRKPNLFAFKNKIWDLNENKFIEPAPFQYISMTCGYVYDGRSKEKEKLVGEIIDKIFTIDDVKQRALELYSTGLSGYRLAKILIQNGVGGNGKSLTNSFLSSMLGDYSIEGNRSIIDINTKSSGGASQELAELNNKRWITYQEPPENANGKSGLNCANVKALTGGNKLNARELYKTKSTVRMTGTNAVECNTKPNLSDTGASMERRLEDIPYFSRFTTRKDEVDEDNNIFFANTEYEQQNFQDDYRISVFHFFAEIYYKLYSKTNSSQFDFTYSKTIDDRNKEYIKENNLIYEWFDSLTCESYDCKSLYNGQGYLEKVKGEEKKNNIINFVDIYEEFKMSIEFDNLEKKEKRELSKKKFLEKFIKIPIIQKDYVENKKKKFGGTIRGYKWIEKVKEIIDEEDEA
tara:strand:+ start:26 stop:2764 length:2739 start_codon:yes stop_codon:yes gene_type:complete